MRDACGSKTLSDALSLKASGRVLILGGYGVRNVGDEAILTGLLNQLPSGARPRVVSRSPSDTQSLHSVKAVSPAGALPELVRSDALIVGGGGLFSSDTGPFGRMIPAFARIALAMGKPVAFHGVGVYPTVSRGLLRDIRSLSNRLELFTVRDRLSHETLAENGIVSELVPDLSASMSLPQADRATRSDLLGLNPGRPVVGLCLTAINESLAAFTLGALPGLMDAMPDVQFCFAPMSQHPSNERHNDLLLARQLRERCEGLTIVDGWHHPSFYLDLFRQFDAVICSRFHSFLFANRVGTPIVPLPYSEKCFGWLSDYGLSAIPHTEAALIDGVQEALQVGRGKRSQEVA